MELESEPLFADEVADEVEASSPAELGGAAAAATEPLQAESEPAQAATPAATPPAPTATNRVVTTRVPSPRC